MESLPFVENLDYQILRLDGSVLLYGHRTLNKQTLNKNVAAGTNKFNDYHFFLFLNEFRSFFREKIVLKITPTRQNCKNISFNKSHKLFLIPLLPLYI